MSQHGETQASSSTRPSLESGNTQESFRLQAEVISKCIEIVQQFRAGKLTKPEASILLQQSIPGENIDETTFVAAYGSYLEMLNNFEQYQTGNSRRADDTWEFLWNEQPNEQEPPNEQPDAGNVIVDSSKWARSPSVQSEEDEDQYVKRTRLDFKTLPWCETDGPEVGPDQALSPSLQKTHALLENFSRDVKQAWSSLLNCNRALPQFPQSEWLNLLNGNAVDLDHVLSNIYTTSHNNKETIELGKNVEILHGVSAPAKTVKTHGDWVIAWDATVNATEFIFRHRKQELQLYGKHVQCYFASLPTQFHSCIINYDRAVWIRASQWQDLELSDLSEFADLQI